jgi:hypothetical protein
MLNRLEKGFALTRKADSFRKSVPQKPNQKGPGLAWVPAQRWTRIGSHDYPGSSYSALRAEVIQYATSNKKAQFFPKKVKLHFCKFLLACTPKIG